ncbi:MAG: hypothetical protein R2827_14475 [Bdellovibrionales bacterium]
MDELAINESLTIYDNDYNTGMGAITYGGETHAHCGVTQITKESDNKCETL